MSRLSDFRGSKNRVNILNYEGLVTKPNRSDRTTWDWKPAVDAAVSEMLAGVGGVLYFPAEAYYFQTDVTVNITDPSFDGNKRISFEGDGPYSTSFVYASTGTMLKIDAPDAVAAAVNTRAAGAFIRDIRFLKKDLDNTSGTALWLKNQAYWNVENCSFDFFDIGSVLESVLSSTFVNCKWRSNHRGVIAQKGAGYSYPNQLTFLQPVFANNDEIGLYALSAGGIRIFGGSVEGNGHAHSSTAGYGILLDDSVDSAGTSVKAVIKGTYFEFNNGAADVSWVSSNTTENGVLDISGCSFESGPTGSGIGVVDRIYLEHNVGTGFVANIYSNKFGELGGWAPGDPVNYHYIKMTGVGTPSSRKLSEWGNYYNNLASFGVGFTGIDGAAGGSGISNILDADDVNAAGITTGEVLYYFGGEFVKKAYALSQLLDIDLTSLATGSRLKYDASATKWKVDNTKYYKTESGAVYTDASGVATITFTETFSGIPQIFLSPVDGTAGKQTSAQVTAGNTTYATIRTSQYNGSTYQEVGPITVFYHAVDPNPS